MPVNRESFKFFEELEKNNNKKWFDANRQSYIDNVREPMKQLAEDIVVPVQSVLPDFQGKPRISRINNDIRFNPKKNPYKIHSWISFYEDNPSPAEIFVFIGKEGWGAGTGIGSNKRDPLDNWRKNLIDNADTWKSMAKAIGLGKKTHIYPGSPYKKPLYDDIPEDVYKMVQAKSVWIVDKGSRKKVKPDTTDFFSALCRVLPIYIFMASTPRSLGSRLKSLSKSVKPPNKDVAKVWKAVG
ncbi:MAG: DUF2461 family protein [candidate division Zixibacteria bacterium]|nr:DUF2461 family protein [candidate division Zixibacteria bacterium]